MKVICKIVLSIALFVSVSYLSYSQDLIKVDTAITVLLDGPFVDARETIRESRFDIYLLRHSNMWHLWQNATFQMELKSFDSTEIDYSKFDIFVDASTSEILTLRDGSPTYSFYPKILYDSQRPDMSRVKIMVLGPEEAVYSRLFEDNIKLKLCTVILKAKDMTTPLPAIVNWKDFKDDDIYFQATAYTYIDSVNTVPEYTIVKQDEDHIEIGWITNYVDIRINPPILRLDFFEVEYTGNLNAVCRYATAEEIDNAGFVIKKGRTTIENWFQDSTGADPRNDLLPDSIFTDVVGDYRLPEFASRMTGLIFSHVGKQYVPIPDTLEHRFVNYVYRLYHKTISDPDGPLRPLATRNLVAPQAVIYAATAFPNPSSGYSKIEYEVTDDVYLTCELFDQNGASIKKLNDDVNGLLDMKYVPRGKYTAIFEAPELAAQGLYDVIFIAYPVNDRSVEISRASVKIQLIRGYNFN